MCTILFAYQMHARFPLIVASNRDEFTERPTAKAAFWKDAPHVLAGRDLVKGGTWLGINREGQFAAVTNYRDPHQSRNGKASRGDLVANFLRGSLDAPSYLAQIQTVRDRYQGFNLLVGNQHDLWYYSNRHNELLSVAPGIHGISNSFLNTPWPKVEKGRAKLEELMPSASADQPDCDALFQLLTSSEQAEDHELPHTGVGLEVERGLSPLFIRLPAYGTRSSTVLWVDTKQHAIIFIERTYADERVVSEELYKIEIL
ncbi:NRDE family protein [Mechercharimyces sp. CAU 1602]|uniref:NRDE family protein n=1 Tax=Mechercharimyces sp. CAU 1602 TaxID=2973933 RepID=UPI002161DC8F|nr:NRDE family protein [Mechercharimyces sp. CAU 1602]MCS1351643.1 NRDE family protein [Mechercharimyces sp. CAU 1602]